MRRCVRIAPLIIAELGPLLAGSASVVGLFVSTHAQGQHFTDLELGLIALAALCFLVAFAVSVDDIVRRQARIMTSAKAIRDYMYRWISGGSRTTIFTRDMSWGHDDEFKTLLHEKASRGELVLFLPAPIPLSEDLRSDGAEVHYYPALGYVTQSRFTIVNTGRSDSRVAIGYGVREGHRVDEFRAGEHPAFHLASDLHEVLKRVAATQA